MQGLQSRCCNSRTPAHVGHYAVKYQHGANFHRVLPFGGQAFAFQQLPYRLTEQLVAQYLQQNGAQAKGAVEDGTVSVLLLAGGSGKRMGASIPKQYLHLRGQPIAMYSLQAFAAMAEVAEIVVVCDPSYRDLFQQYHDALTTRVPMRFALPGKERQDSVYSGLQAISSGSALVAVHDSARPLVEAADASRCFADAAECGAAVLGVPVKPTIKEVDLEGRVVKTLDRSRLWEVQTPQVIEPSLLQRGFEVVRDQGLEVTDDVSIIEALGLPVTVTRGSYTNIKVTTPEDMLVAEGFLDDRKCRQPAPISVLAVPQLDEC